MRLSHPVSGGLIQGTEGPIPHRKLYGLIPLTVGPKVQPHGKPHTTHKEVRFSPSPVTLYNLGRLQSMRLYHDYNLLVCRRCRQRRSRRRANSDSTLISSASVSSLRRFLRNRTAQKAISITQTAQTISADLMGIPRKKRVTATAVINGTSSRSSGKRLPNALSQYFMLASFPPTFEPRPMLAPPPVPNS